MENKPTETEIHYTALGFCIAVTLFTFFAIWFVLNYEVCTVLK